MDLRREQDGGGFMVMRSALFVDFDNVLLGLQPTSKVGAQRFATSPETWLPWFEAAGHVDDEARDERRILLRRVYMNPDRFGTYRKYFTYCGLETIDCPSLTGMGKNSADIRMVLDIVDALDHPTRFDEFIILSADADFTPVLQKLRAHDRETAVLSTPLTARPLKSAATYAFEVDDFLENALGVSTDTKFDETSVAKVLPLPLAPPPPNSVPLRRAAEILEAHVRKQGWTPTSEVARILLAEQPEFADSQWLGQGKLNAMLSAALQARPGSYARKLRDGVHGIGVAPADEVVAPGAIPPDSADLPAAILEAPTRAKFSTSSSRSSLDRTNLCSDRLWGPSLPRSMARSSARRTGSARAASRASSIGLSARASCRRASSSGIPAGTRHPIRRSGRRMPPVFSPNSPASCDNSMLWGGRPSPPIRSPV
ncbi:NYN domain-containing protein [Rubellimicrobium mesophilum]|uniref:NYN domain-containing protein n=1 Tax=Rubellimicrobium mesophilum TaxID=1123067 RepID=UPI00147071E2|nr:NYN domain-containing protein [Rubellimicrobium mesophilum]